MKQSVKIWRDVNGIPHVEAGNTTDLYWGVGYVHATDRGMQMLLMRILGQGRASEILDSSDSMLTVDMFFRKVNWNDHVQSQLDQLSELHMAFLRAYSEGVNAAFAEKCPWDLRLLGYRHEPWAPADCIMLVRMIGYLTLVQSQDEVERLFVELVQGGVLEAYLQELFPGLLEGLDIDLLKQVTLPERIIPASVRWNLPLPRMMASNNWVISGKKTRSGQPLLSNDPHLEVNRLPNVWCEMAIQVNEAYMLGGTMPGLPGILTGRNRNLSWGVTYSFIDAIDSWMEKCRDGKFYREAGDQWIAFTRRKEIIKRKKKAPVAVTFYENEHGVLDGDPAVEGYYLATRWAAGDSGARSFAALFNMWDAKTVEAGMDTLGQVETGWNWVFADTAGNIGFQMSGLAPKRRDGLSGLIPMPGWKKENDWQGFYSHTEMPRCYNPEKGYFSTANQDLNPYGQIKPINMPMGSYRADRIDQLLESGERFTREDIYQMHFDVYSLEAETFLKILRPLLPDTPQGQILKDWDLCYSADSKGAFLFEEFFKGLYREVFGKNVMGESVIDFLASETGVFIDFYDKFNRILLSEESVWFNGSTRDEIFQKVAEKALKVAPQAWGENRKVTLTNILFDGKLPGFLGFDRGPFVGIGGRATIHQGQIYRAGNRGTTFFPSYRTVSDMSSDDVRTNLAGGPSDRRFSKYYCSDFDNWLNGKYKKISTDSDQTKLPFK